jgi:hypothetical protein
MKKKDIDLTGQKIGRLLVIEKCVSMIDKNYREFWKCKCDCGEIKYIRHDHLLSNSPTKSCGCITKELIRELGKKGTPESHRKSGLTNRNKDREFIFINRFINRAKMNARKRKLVYSLDYDVVKCLIHSPCFYCGELPSSTLILETTKEEMLYNGIDRIDSSLGYIKNNCVPCCKYCNRAKSDMSTEEFSLWIYKIYNYMIKERKEFDK